jgi:hypothetical protein
VASRGKYYQLFRIGKNNKQKPVIKSRIRPGANQALARNAQKNYKIGQQKLVKPSLEE